MPGREKTPSVPAAARELARIGRSFHVRGWALGTSGNFSAVTSRRPLRLTITASGQDKGSLSASSFVTIGEDGRPLKGPRRPSSEAPLHLAIVRACGAGSVIHTHSLFATLLSDQCAHEGGLALRGYEMLKGLEGVASHEHREWLAVMENSQDHADLADRVGRHLARHPEAHGLLLRRHGLYTWGRDVAQAARHAEILEFLLEVEGRRLAGMGN